MEIRIVRNPFEWNAIVEKSPYSVLHHRYECFRFYENPLPLMVKEQNHQILFPLRLIELLRGFRLAIGPIYDYASILPADENALDLVPRALNCATQFLRQNGVDYFALCAPTFHSEKYTNLLDSWFKKNKASVKILRANMIRIEHMTFEEIFRSKFSKLARYNIRRAEREGIDILELKNENDIYHWIDDIYQCNLSALQRQGRQWAYPESYKEIYAFELVRDKIRLAEWFKIYGAIYHGKLIAYTIAVWYKNVMQIGKLMSHTKFLDKRPNDALLAHAIEDACENGVKLFEYGLYRTGINTGNQSLYPGVEMFFTKFGFEKIPIFIYRLGLDYSGRLLQHVFSYREYFLTRWASFPMFIKKFFLKLYAPRRRKLFALLHT